MAATMPSRHSTLNKTAVVRYPTCHSRADALYVCTDALANTNRIRINIAAVGQRLHGSRDYVEAGGLMSYGPNFPDLFRRAGDFVDKILRGAKPADLPVEQPTKFDLVVNLTTAKALGIDVHASLNNEITRAPRQSASGRQPGFMCAAAHQGGRDRAMVPDADSRVDAYMCHETIKPVARDKGGVTGCDAFRLRGRPCRIIRNRVTSGRACIA
jgi:ABC transporter substrate binding protein